MAGAFKGKGQTLFIMCKRDWMDYLGTERGRAMWWFLEGLRLEWDGVPDYIWGEDCGSADGESGCGVS